MIDEQFADGDSDAIDDDGVANTLEQDLRWYLGSSSTVVTVNSSGGTGVNGNGLFVDSNGPRFFVVAPFDADTSDAVPFTAARLGAPGSGTEILQLTFNLRVFGNTALATDANPAANSTDEYFRFGLFNLDASNPVTNGSTNSQTDFGYRVHVPVGPGSAANPIIYSEDGTSPDVLLGSDNADITAASSPGRLAGTATRSISLTLTRTGSGVDLALSVYSDANGQGALLMAAFGSDVGGENNNPANQTGVFTAFNEIGFNVGADFNYRLDDIRLVSIPEPGALTMGLLGVFGLAVRRQRKQRYTS